MNEQTNNNQTKIYIIAAIILVVLILAVSLFLILYKPNNSSNQTSSTTNTGEIVVPVSDDNSKIVLICGQDNSKLIKTDAIMLAHINSTDKKITLVNLPRDIVLTKYAQTLGEVYGTKYNEALLIYGQGNEKTASKQAMEFLKTELAEALDIKIDDYALVSLDAFKTAVNNMGGVEFVVPRDMDYEDPYQNLSIHLKAGKQTLTGEQAEMLVRYKIGYTNDDLGRIDVLQNLAKALLNKAMKEMDVIKLSSVAIPVLNNLTTSIDITKLTDYVKTFYELKSVDNVTTVRLPGNLIPSVTADGTVYKYYVDKTGAADCVLSNLNPTHKTASDIKFDKNGLFATVI